jgi:endonuclease/exonuclease/phosphatase family metal-dependent hydrolase
LSSAGQHHLDGVDQLRVLHWNIHSWRDADGGSNLEAVSDLIRHTTPHVVSLTEVDERWGAAARLQELAARNGYLWLFTPSFVFGGDAPAGGFGNALLTTLPILAVQQWQLLWPPRLYDGTEPTEPRSATLAKLVSPRHLCGWQHTLASRGLAGQDRRAGPTHGADPWAERSLAGVR